MGEPATRREVPPRFAAALIVVVVIVAVVALAVQDHSSHSSDPAPAASAPAQARSVAALAASNGRFYAIADGHLAELAADGSVVATGTVVHAAADSTSTQRLLPDPATRTVWVLPDGGGVTGGAGHAEAYAMDGLRLLRRVALPGAVRAVAVLDGTLFVSSVPSLYALTRTARSFAKRTASGIVAMAADATRHRLIVAEPAVDGVRISSYSPKGGAGRGAGFTLSLKSLVVSGRVIWAAGSTSGGAWLARLDPGTLRLAAHATGLPATDGNATIVALGDASLFVRTDPAAQALRCIDARTGASRRAWPALPGAIAATRGHAFAAQLPGPARSITLGSCPG